MTNPWAARPSRNHLQLDTPFAACGRIESTTGHKLAALDQIRREVNFDDLRRSHTQARRVDRLVRVPAECAGDRPIGGCFGPDGPMG